jgi:hypothetical protein
MEFLVLTLSCLPKRKHMGYTQKSLKLASICIGNDLYKKRQEILHISGRKGWKQKATQINNNDETDREKGEIK